ncbi:MAG: hypothetical protein ACKOW9_00350 [Candidatus Paceibacterota bacterium]
MRSFKGFVKQLSNFFVTGLGIKSLPESCSLLTELECGKYLDDVSYLHSKLEREGVISARSHEPGVISLYLNNGNVVVLIHDDNQVVEQVLAMTKLGSVRFEFKLRDDIILVTACLEGWRYAFKSTGGIYLDR